MFEGLKILYLEDETLVALDTGDYLETLGFGEVKLATRLAQAEAMVAETRFDLALLDINVDRGQTSLALGQELSKRGTLVVFASGNSNAGQKLQEEGAYFLDKPFSLDHLYQLLCQAVSGSRSGMAKTGGR